MYFWFKERLKMKAEWYVSSSRSLIDERYLLYEVIEEKIPHNMWGKAYKASIIKKITEYIPDIKLMNAEDMLQSLMIYYFAESYLKGETPSPCILCNRYLKLGLLIDKARALGADVVVTGHYADILLTTHGVELHRAKDLVNFMLYLNCT